MAVSARTVISWRLVAIPIVMYTATQTNGISFNQLHGSNGSRIKYKRVCAHCGEAVNAEDIVKYYHVVPEAEGDKSLELLLRALIDEQKISPARFCSISATFPTMLPATI